MRRGVDAKVKAFIKEGFDLFLLQKGEVLLDQGDTKLYKTLTIDQETRMIEAEIPAEDTLLFDVGSYKIIFRFLTATNKIVSSRVFHQSCGDGFDDVMNRPISVTESSDVSEFRNVQIESGEIPITQLTVEGSIEYIDGTNNYNDLRNKPSINGTTLVGNYNEIDPTVPEYVKNGKAVNEDNIESIGILEVKSIWDSIFKN